METTLKAAKTSKPGQYLTFTLNARPFGVSIETVREINRMGDITPVPHTPSYVAGVMNLRGKVIPVVDLRAKFGIPVSVYTRETCIIVIEANGSHTGMIVDSVSEVVDLEKNQIEPPPLLGDNTSLSYILGMGKVNDRVIILVDILEALAKEDLDKYVDTMQNAAA